MLLDYTVAVNYARQRQAEVSRQVTGRPFDGYAPVRSGRRRRRRRVR